MTSAKRFALLVFVGTALLQAAWILAVPPFRASDEFDHAYRAAGVAQGQWRLTEESPLGRGLVVRVPKGIVDAASAQCDALAYTRPGNCHPIEDAGDGMVTVTTAAAPYNPLYYVVVGLPTRWLDGASALYAMRALSSLLCAAGVALAALLWARAGAGTWGRLGFIASLTPVLVYSTVIPAPNGLEMTAGLVLWVVLVALAVGHQAVGSRRVLIGVATVAGCLLGLLRTLGPLWLGLIVVAVVAAVGLRRSALLVRRNQVVWAAGSALVLAAVAAGAWWNASSGLMGTSADAPGVSDRVDVATWTSRVVVWTLQLVGAFPLRNQVAPMGVYALYVLVVGGFLLASVLVLRGRRRLLVGGLALVALVIPVGLTMLTASSQGVVWQGRYELPLVVGILPLCGFFLDVSGKGFGQRRWLGALGALMLGAAHVWSVMHVLPVESGRAVSATDPGWFRAPSWTVAALAVAGTLAFCLALHQSTWAAKDARPTPLPASPRRRGAATAGRGFGNELRSGPTRGRAPGS